jgi:NAD(P)-dependent dehydrogenase (short-subunit alcohol dehydrogenase family)
MDLKLTGKRALVTGSSSGIGQGIATMLAAEGAQVVVHGRNVERANAVAKSIIDNGGQATVALGDLSTETGAAAVGDAVEQAVSGIDILVNNSGGSDGTAAKDWESVTEAEWDSVYQANALAAVRLIRRFLPGMKARQWGRIIQIASASGIQPIPFGPNYSAAKAAMINLTASLPKSLRGQGITVNTVSPGLILTPALERWINGIIPKMGWEALSRQEVERRLAADLPIALEKIGRPEDIGHVVCMLASPGGGFITGANFRVDGGQCQSVN